MFITTGKLGEEEEAIPLENMSHNTVINNDTNKPHQQPPPATTTTKDVLPEKEGLLLSEPVKLSPGWEEANSRNEDELNFRTLVPGSMKPAPRDRFYFVWLIMLLHGLGVLMPWNMFITAESYFRDYKLAGDAVHVNISMNVSASNGSAYETELQYTETEYRKNFIEYLGITAQLPNLLLNFVNVFLRTGGTSRLKIVYAIIVMIVLFILTVILAMLDSTTWPAAFFYITMITVAIINSATGLYQNSIFGLAAILPMKYTAAVVLGTNLSGTLTSVLSIISVVSSPNPRTSAIWYFTAAIFMLLICLITYFALPLLRYFRYFDNRDQLLAKQNAINRPTIGRMFHTYSHIFRQISVQCWNIWFVFFVTLTCFPAVMAKIEAVNVKAPFINELMDENLFTVVTCFLSFNAFAAIGNIIPNCITFPGPRWIFIPILLRAAFIPLLMMCNYSPDDRSVPSWFQNDWVYIGLGVLMAFTSGYFSSLVMMYTPSLVEGQHAGTAAQMAAFFLVFGIFCGVSFSRVTAWIIEEL